MAEELKKHIYENDKIPFLLESIGCHSITRHTKEYRAGLPNKTNATSVSVKCCESLKSRIYTSDISMNGDIISLIMEIKSFKFVDALKFAHNILGLNYSKHSIQTKLTPVDIFKRARRKAKFDVADIDLYDESILSEYTPNLTLEWLKEGITSVTAREFDIGYDFNHKRIIIPHKMYGEEGKVAGIIGRTTVEDYELLGIAKYLAIKPYPKSLNVYGLIENYKYIQEAGYVVVFEAEKSVLKRHSLLDKTGCAIFGHTLSKRQVQILIGLDVEIILAYDSDITLEHILKECNHFKGIRPVSYMYDEYGIMGEKESPADQRNKVYNKMLEGRVKL